MRGGQQSPALGELTSHRPPVIRRLGQAVWGLVSAHQCSHGLISVLGRLNAISVTLIKEIIHGNAAWLRHHFRHPGARWHAAKCSIHYLYRDIPTPSPPVEVWCMHAKSFIMASGPQPAAWMRVSSPGQRQPHRRVLSPLPSPQQPAPRPLQQLHRPPRGSRSG